MEIPKSGIIHVARIGSMSLMVVEQFYCLKGYELKEEQIEKITIPDNWIIKLKPNLTPCLKNDNGRFYLTQQGWQINKKEIKYNFELAEQEGLTKGCNWNDFEKFAVQHFKTVKKKRDKLLIKLQSQIDEIKKLEL